MSFTKEMWTHGAMSDVVTTRSIGSVEQWVIGAQLVIA